MWLMVDINPALYHGIKRICAEMESQAEEVPESYKAIANGIPYESRCEGCSYLVGENLYLGECVECIRFTRGRTDKYKEIGSDK